MSKVKRQYGTWSSPLDVPTLAAQKRLSDVQWDTTSSTLVWSESRGKHGALVAQNGVDAPRDLTPLSVRGRVGYGGGDFTVHEGTVYFVSDGRIFKLSLDGGGATDITSAFGGAAAPTVSPDGKWLVFVHTYQDDDVLALVDTDGKMWSRKLASGTDFAMQPVWQPDGNQIAYIVWDHPNMPWDHTELRLLTLDTDGSGVPYVTRVDTLAHNASIMQPEFSPDGRYLSYVSDQSGFWQIYLHDLSNGETKMLTGPESGLNTESAYNENYNIPSEQGAPGWIQGMRVYGWQADSRHLYFLRNQEGFISLWQCDIREMTTTQTGIFAEYTSISQITVASSGAVAALVSASRIPERVVSFTSPAPSMPSISMPDTPSIGVIVDDDYAVTGERVHSRAAMEHIPQEALSEFQPVRWQGDDGEQVFGLYAPPISTRFEGTGKPPLIVYIHGGPTSQVTAKYDARTQFFATRGFAVLQVNHRGSTGYGREYRNKLRGNWGICDTQDAVSGAKYLVDQGLADAGKFVVMGGSAGGFTVLQSLVEYPGFFKAGVCLYGVSNHYMLVQDTHKFEARYPESLVGVLPDAADVYRERSPYFHADKIVDPIILFQGAEDNVVPRNQSDSIVRSLKARGVPHEYHVYEFEGHGFRKPETLEHFYQATLDFLTAHVIYG